MICSWSQAIICQAPIFAPDYSMNPLNALLLCILLLNSPCFAPTQRTFVLIPGCSISLKQGGDEFYQNYCQFRMKIGKYYTDSKVLSTKGRQCQCRKVCKGLKQPINSSTTQKSKSCSKIAQINYFIKISRLLAY